MKYSIKSTDNELITGCVEQHRMAQKYLYEKYYGQLLGICMRYTRNRDEATDILNQAFLKIFNSIARYEPTGSFKGWMARIVYNCSIDHVRRQKSYRKHMNFESEQDLPTYNEGLNRLQAEDIYKLIQQLPEASQAVFSMYVIEGFKHKEIAVELGISEGTSKWHLSNARKILRGLLENINQKKVQA